MSSVVSVITKFQNVALITTGGAVAYWYFQDVEKPAPDDGPSHKAHAGMKENSKAHNLKGEVVDKEKQVV